MLLTTFTNYTWGEDEREKSNNSLLLLTPNKIPGNAEFFILYFGSVDNSAQCRKMMKLLSMVSLGREF